MKQLSMYLASSKVIKHVAKVFSDNRSQMEGIMSTDLIQKVPSKQRDKTKQWRHNHFGFLYKKLCIIVGIDYQDIHLTTYPENTHRWGKDHCTAGLQFNKTGLDRQRK